MRFDFIMPAKVQITHAANKELLAHRWLKHESAFKSVRGLRLLMPAHDKHKMSVSVMCVLMCIHLCIRQRWNVYLEVIRPKCMDLKMYVCRVTVHVWASLGVRQAQNPLNATGMRISVALPWQQTNARADGSSRIKPSAHHSRGRRTKDPIKHHHLSSFSSSISVRRQTPAHPCGLKSRHKFAVCADFHFFARSCGKRLCAQWHTYRRNSMPEIQQCAENMLEAEQVMHHHHERCSASRWMSTW